MSLPPIGTRDTPPRAGILGAAMNREWQVDVWLRGTDFAKTQIISGVSPDPSAWTDQDVSTLLKAMLLAIHRAKHPESTDTSVFLRGFSWIVNPFEDRGVVIEIGRASCRERV